jgi:hypothetical protein
VERNIGLNRSNKDNNSVVGKNKDFCNIPNKDETDNSAADNGDAQENIASAASKCYHQHYLSQHKKKSPNKK